MVNKDSHTGIAVLGFVDNMHELLEASDFAITKAGPSTVFEHLVKRVPPILTHSAGLQEKGNADFCLNNKVGWFINNQEELQDLMDRILNTAILEEYRENIERNGLSDPFPRLPTIWQGLLSVSWPQKEDSPQPEEYGPAEACSGTRINIRITMQKHKDTVQDKKPDMKAGSTEPAKYIH